MIAVAFTRPREESPVSRKALVAGGAVFFAALVLSYSRASLINVAVALAVLMWCNRRRVRLAARRAPGRWRRLLTWWIFPTFAQMYWMRLSDQRRVLCSREPKACSPVAWPVGRRWPAGSPRIPWQAMFGIGYKTLPYTNFLGTPVVADNMYLSLLVETGVAGLAALIWLNVAILRAAARRSQRSFFGMWMLCFWAGPDGADWRPATC